jgi:hypothetical protein
MNCCDYLQQPLANKTGSQITPASVSSLLAQLALIELGFEGWTGKSLLAKVADPTTMYKIMAIAGTYRAIAHMWGADRWQTAKFPE